jgi:HEAT repeat protein
MDTEGDIFGNLREWEKIADQISELSKTGKIDIHQAGLVRILRYKDNWKTREIVLKAIKDLKMPRSNLLSELLCIMENDREYYMIRMLASEAIESLFANDAIQFPENRRAIASQIAARVKPLASTSWPPVLRDSLSRCLKVIQNAS